MGLVGCTAEHQARVATQNRADVKEAVDAYDDQHVRPGEPHAVLSAQPRRIDEVAVFSPYRLAKLNGKDLERPAYSFTKARPLPRDLAFSELKIPPGLHDLTIASGAVRHYVTTVSQVRFEAGKRYAIVEGPGPDGEVAIHIAEYRQDKRFAPGEKEYYLIGKRISDAVERGGSTVLIDLEARQ